MTLAIHVEGLTKTFGDFNAVSRLNMEIPKGMVYGFLGPNGSGKTTAIRMMCGLLEPSSGSISVLGMAVPAQAEEIRLQVGYMTQRFSLYGDLTVDQNLNFLGRIMGVTGKALKKRKAEIKTQFQLDSFSSFLAGSLSGGQKRRLALAAAVIHQPRLLILDEPTSEVDPNTRREFWDQLFTMCDNGTTILVTTHLMDEAERCHHLAIINEGVKVADGSPESLKENLGATMFEVHGDNPGNLKRTLHYLEPIIAITQVGLSLRVMLDPALDKPEEWLNERLKSFLNITIHPTAPSIEDVFVMATQGREQRENHGRK